MKAVLSNYRQAPRKVRLVAGLIKGKTVARAAIELSFLTKRAAEPFAKLLASAVSNALANSGIKEDNLYIESVTVNKGVTMKRFMPRARGSASRINKRGSHLEIVLKEAEAPKLKAKKTKN